MNDIERQKDHFESIAAEYYHARHSENHLLLKELIWGHFLANKEYLKKSTLTVLEPMCGYAEGAQILKHHLKCKILYEGFDYSRSLVDIVKQDHPDIFIYQEDVVKYRPLKKYDIIILLGGLHHVYKYAGDVVQNLSAALNSGGYFISFEPTHNNFLFRSVRARIYDRNKLFDAATERAFDLDELDGHFLDSGFTLLDQIYPGLLSYVLYYNPDAFPMLNVGGKALVKTSFLIDRLFIRNMVGKKLSFATLSLWQKK